MRILYFSQPFYPFQYGGSERIFFSIAKEMAKKHECLVIAQRIKGLKDREKIEGIEIRRVGLPLSSYSSTFSNSFLVDFSYFLEATLIGLKEGRNFDLIHSNPFMGSLSAKLVSFLLRKKHIITIHDVFLQDKNYKNISTIKQKIGKILESFLLSSKFIHTPSETTKKDIIKATKGMKNKRIFVIPNGIEIKNYKVKKKENFGVFIGRLVFYKNVDFLIRVMRIVAKKQKNFKLIIIGSGPEEKKLKNLAKSYGLEERISFEGNISEEEKIEKLAKSKLFLFPSSIEGFGISVLEAMASGNVVIVNDVEPLNKLVKKDFGFCLSLKENEWANCILRVLKDEELRRKLAKNALKEARNYDIKEICRELEKVYRKVLEGNQ
ncbi:MAG: glycosyltransferase family 4 protein [Candidatus Micrarchaeales archaeon]